MNHNIKIMEENPFSSPVGRKHQDMYPKGFSKRFNDSKEEKMVLKQHKNTLVKERKIKNATSLPIVHQEVITVPLTLEDTALYHPVMEVKPTGTYWENYADNDSIINSEKRINYKWS